jgi:DNA-binding MarR family transcriptional regulator
LAPDLLDGLVQTSFAVMAVLNLVGARYELSLTQMRLLGILRDRRPKMAELASYLGLERSTVSGLVDRAEQRGLVERRAATGDGRSVEVGCSAAGELLAQTVVAEVATLLAPMTDVLNAVDRRRLSELLVRVGGVER